MGKMNVLGCRQTQIIAKGTLLVSLVLLTLPERVWAGSPIANPYPNLKNQVVEEQPHYPEELSLQSLNATVQPPSGANMRNSTLPAENFDFAPPADSQTFKKTVANQAATLKPADTNKAAGVQSPAITSIPNIHDRPSKQSSAQDNLSNTVNKVTAAEDQPAIEIPKPKDLNKSTRPILPAMRVYSANAEEIGKINYGEASIRLLSNAEAKIPEYFVKDIAENISANSPELKKRIENFSLGRLQLGQDNVNMTAQDLLIKLQYGFPKVKFHISGSAVSISYQALTLSAAEQDKLIHEYIQNNAPTFAHYVVNYLQPLESVQLPANEPSYKIEAFGPSLPSSLFQNWKLSLFSQNVLFKHLWIRARLHAPSPQVNMEKEVAATDQNKASNNDKTNSAQGFEQFFHAPVEELSVSSPPKSTASAGPAPSNFIFSAQGNLPAKTVQKNQPIELVFEGNGIELKTSALSLDAGNLGDFIRVKNQNTSQVVTARIVNPYQVLINE